MHMLATYYCDVAHKEQSKFNITIIALGKDSLDEIFAFSRFTRVPRKFSMNTIYKLHIMALFKCFKRKAPQ